MSEETSDSPLVLITSTEEMTQPQRPPHAIAVLESRQEVHDVEQAVAAVLLEAWPDWKFERAINTDLTGPNGEAYIRLDRITWHALGLGDEDTDDPEKRRGPPTDDRVPTRVRELVSTRVQEMPQEWRGDDEV